MLVWIWKTIYGMWSEWLWRLRMNEQKKRLRIAPRLEQDQFKLKLIWRWFESESNLICISYWAIISLSVHPVPLFCLTVVRFLLLALCVPIMRYAYLCSPGLSGYLSSRLSGCLAGRLSVCLTAKPSAHSFLSGLLSFCLVPASVQPSSLPMLSFQGQTHGQSHRGRGSGF